MNPNPEISQAEVPVELASSAEETADIVMVPFGAVRLSRKEVPVTAQPLMLFNIFMLIFVLSGIPALILFEVFKVAVSLHALGSAMVVTNNVLTLFYVFTVGAAIPTLSILLLSGFFFARNQGHFQIELSKDGLTRQDRRRSVPRLLSRFNDFLTQFGNTSFVPWSRIKSICFMPSGFLRIEIETGMGLKEVDFKFDSKDDLIRFVDSHKNFVPEGKLKVDDSTRRLLSTARTSGYTELWFSQFKDERLNRGDLLAPGTRLKEGAYVISKVLARGGMANVYLASATQYGKTVVLKEFILNSLEGNPLIEHEPAKGCADSYENERKVLIQLNHPNIAQFRDSFQEDKRAYLVLEWIEGETLFDRVTREGPLSQAEVKKIAFELCLVLKYLHSFGTPIVHRDITPHNLIVENGGKVTLIDFNAALHEYRKPDERDEVIGKPAYFAPEQFRGKATTQSDVYAMGATLYFLLTGQEPVPISVSHPREVKADVSAEFDAIVARATQSDPHKRYLDADQVMADLLILEVES